MGIDDAYILPMVEEARTRISVVAAEVGCEVNFSRLALDPEKQPV